MCVQVVVKDGVVTYFSIAVIVGTRQIQMKNLAVDQLKHSGIEGAVTGEHEGHRGA
jgi:hypothetical protein